MRFICILPLLFASATALAADTAASLAADTVDVQHVMAAYHEAVVHHDGARMASLFLPEGSLWLNVLSDEAYAAAQARAPGAAKVRPGSVAAFAGLVSTTPARFDPRHTDLHINCDGTIASVYFDFVFHVDGKAQNHGSEAWQLVRGSNGWRIAAITYSSHGAPQ